MTLLSICIPVYNVENYIRPCMESIFHQGLDDDYFEVILINDGTKDNSIGVIQDIVSQHHNIVIVNQENQGLSVVRNKGIDLAKGEYILMPDSDDLLINNSLPPLLQEAVSTKADLVVADFLKMNDEELLKTDVNSLQQEEFTYQVKTGEQLFLEDLDPHCCYVWRTLYRREFLIENNLRFVPGIYIQDMPFTHECYLKAKKCIRTNWLLNIYRLGHDSATSNFNTKKEKDFCTSIAKTWGLRQLPGLTPAVQIKLRNDVYTSFTVMICSTCHVIRKASERKEIVDYLKQIARDLTFDQGKKQRLISWLFRSMPHTYVELRYYYGVIMEDRILPMIKHWIKG